MSYSRNDERRNAHHHGAQDNRRTDPCPEELRRESERWDKAQPTEFTGDRFDDNRHKEDAATADQERHRRRPKKTIYR